jgi:hypothetical protein
MSDFHYPSTTPKARKDYHCMACENIQQAWNDADIQALPDNERDAYELARSHNFRIHKGEKYVCQSGVYDGEFYTFRGIPAMVDICHKYELFEEV